MGYGGEDRYVPQAAKNTAQLCRLEARVVELRHRDDIIGSRELLPLVRAELDSVSRLADETVYTDRLAVRLRTVIAELAQLVGWIASDAGYYRYAEQVYLAGTIAADTAGDRVLGAQLLSSLAYQITNIGKREDGLLIAKTAVASATNATPTARALLLERLAWAAARCHDPDTCQRALDAVDDAYDRRHPGITEPEWVYWLNRAEVDVMAARCHIQLGQPAHAEPCSPAPWPATTATTCVRSASTKPGWPKATPVPATSTPPAPSSTASTPAPSQPAPYASNAASTPSTA